MFNRLKMKLCDLVACSEQQCRWIRPDLCSSYTSADCFNISIIPLQASNLQEEYETRKLLLGSGRKSL